MSNDWSGKLDIVVVLELPYFGAVVEEAGQDLSLQDGIGLSGFLQELHSLNENLLARLGLCRDSVTSVSQDDADELEKSGFLESAISLLKRNAREEGRLWLKHGSMVKLLPFWRRVFQSAEMDIGYIVLVEKPSSYKQRLGAKVGKSDLIWLSHISTAISETQGELRFLVDVERLMESRNSDVQRITKVLGSDAEEALVNLLVVRAESAEGNEPLKAGAEGLPGLPTRLYEALRSGAESSSQELEIEKDLRTVKEVLEVSGYIDEVEMQRDSLEVARNKVAATLEAKNAELEAQTAMRIETENENLRLSALVESAVAWQKRSAIDRALHKWSPEQVDVQSEEAKSGIQAETVVTELSGQKDFAPHGADGKKVTVIVASYNYADLLPQTLGSILDQTHVDFEVLVVDDGSKDDSVRVINEFATKDPRVNLILHERGANKGLRATIQRALAQASGDWIAFCESDDWWDANHLSGLLRAVDGKSGVHAAFSDVVLEGRSETMEQYCDVMREHYRSGGDAVGMLRKKWNVAPTFSCVMIRRDVFMACDFDVPFLPSLDLWLWAQVVARGEFAFVDQASSHWRQHETSYMKKSQSVREDHTAEIAALYEGIENFIENAPRESC